MRRINAGEASESLIKQFIQEVHNSWKAKASQYVNRLEDQRNADKQEYEQTIRDLRAGGLKMVILLLNEHFPAVDHERQENRVIQAQFAMFLLKIGDMQKDQEKFYDVQGGVRIEALHQTQKALN